MLADAIGSILALAVGVAISPLPVVAVVLLLAGPRGRVTGIAFVAGWMGGLALLATLVLLVGDGAGATDEAGPASWVGVLEVVLGAALVGFAIRQWSQRPRDGEQAPLPGWMRTMDSFTATKAVRFGVLLAAVNPKNFLLTVAAATSIAEVGLPAGEAAIAVAVFVVVATLGTGLPVAISFAGGRRAQDILDDLRRWLALHNSAVMAVVLLVIGTKVLGEGLAAL